MGKGKVEGIKKLMQKTKDAIKDSKKKLLKLANDLKTASRKQQTVNIPSIFVFKKIFRRKKIFKRSKMKKKKRRRD